MISGLQDFNGVLNCQRSRLLCRVLCPKYTFVNDLYRPYETIEEKSHAKQMVVETFGRPDISTKGGQKTPELLLKSGKHAIVCLSFSKPAVQL